MSFWIEFPITAIYSAACLLSLFSLYNVCQTPVYTVAQYESLHPVIGDGAWKAPSEAKRSALIKNMEREMVA